MGKLAEQKSVEVELTTRIVAASERALMVYFDNPLSTTLAQMIGHFCTVINLRCNGLNLALTPSYTSVLVQYDPLETDHFAVKQLIDVALAQVTSEDSPAAPNTLDYSQKHDSEQPTDTTETKVVELPVYYGPEVGLDLSRIAEHHGLSIQQVIDLHQSQLYRVFAIGFAPGFAYMGEVDKQIAMPRLSTPRQSVPKGAVAIADRQTAVYPATSPGGWNIVGRCPVNMFEPDKTPSMPFAVGDSIKFIAIDLAQFQLLGGKL